MFITVSSSISVTPRCHWVSAWLLRFLARPFVSIDGSEHGARWGTALTVIVPPGRHTVSAGIRYRGFKTLLGVRPQQLQIDVDRHIELKAQNGLLNHEPFRITTTRELSEPSR